MNNDISELISRLSEDNMISQGSYRTVHHVDDCIVKSMKDVRVKNYGPLKVNFPLLLYTFFKFGVKDFNDFELENYLKIKDVITKRSQNYSENIPSEMYVDQYEGKSYMFSKAVYNRDGTLARSISSYGAINDDSFWNRIEEINNVLIENKIFHTEISASNILVKETETGLIPVLVDFKRVGKRTYPFQPWLLFDSLLEKNMIRHLYEMKEKYAG